MPLGKRNLTVTLAMPSGNVVLDASLDMKVKIAVSALAVQSMCEITVTNLSVQLRSSLLSQFTAWNKRNIESGKVPQVVPSGQTPTLGTQQSYVNVAVTAGYENPGQPSNAVQIFAGQVVLAKPFGELPNMGFKITCFTQQLSKVTWTTQVPPGQMTFKAYVAWVAGQYGVPFVCETSYDDRLITNPGASIHTVGDLLVDLQSYYRPNVAAYFDSRANMIIVKDVNAVITSANTVTIDEFINMPLWDEWGVTFVVLFNPQIVLAGQALLKSVMNPDLNGVGWVINQIDYYLTTRDNPFDMRVHGLPPA